MQWQENVRTVEGNLLHEKAHNPLNNEKRNGVIITRAMPIHSKELGVSGECDVVEFHQVSESEGISLAGRDGFYQVVPIEYKKGKPKKNDIDILQLVSQVLCLEEMLCCQIPVGYLFYGETKRRVKVDIEEAIREKTKALWKEMHGYYERKYTPKVKWSKSCNACSLKDICLPVLGKGKRVVDYIEKKITEDL